MSYGQMLQNLIVKLEVFKSKSNITINHRNSYNILTSNVDVILFCHNIVILVLKKMNIILSLGFVVLRSELIIVAYWKTNQPITICFDMAWILIEVTC